MDHLPDTGTKPPCHCWPPLPTPSYSSISPPKTYCSETGRVGSMRKAGESPEWRAGCVPASSWGHWAQSRDKPLPQLWPRQGEGCGPQIRRVQILPPSPQFIPCLSCESIRWPNPSWGGLAGALLIMHWQPHTHRCRRASGKVHPLGAAAASGLGWAWG